MSLNGHILDFWRLPSIDRIAADQMNAVRRATPTVVTGNLLNSSIILVGFWGHAQWQFLVVWYGATCLLCLHACSKWINGRDITTYVVTRRRISRAVASSFLFGLPWGLLSFIHLGAMPAHCELVLVTVSAGMAGGGSIYLAPMFPAAVAYLLAVLGPIVLKAFLVSAAGYTVFGLLALSYGAFLWSVICWSAKQHLERSETNTALRDKTSLLQAIVDNFSGGIVFFDQASRGVVFNDTAKALLDLPHDLFEHGPPHLDAFARAGADCSVHRTDGAKERMPAPHLLARDHTGFQCEMERPDGVILDVRGLPVAGGGFLMTYMDITDRRRSEVAIRHLARHDPLTGLANRAVFRERLEHALSGNRPGDRHLALISVDLDRFKEINDTLGHPVGDRLLVEVAARMAKCVRDNDILARLGGDEFAILLFVSDPMREPAALATQILNALEYPIDLGDHIVSINASLGIAISPADALTMEELLKKSDLALLEAKAAGRNRYKYYETQMDLALGRRRAIERGLGSALLNREFTISYQPILDLASERVCCFEALLRWESAELGSVPPQEFIKVAEDTGLVLAIGRWVLQEACRQAVLWPAHVRIAVNLSPAQFKDGLLIEHVAEAMLQAGLEPARLELEVTETAMLSEIDGVFTKLDELRRMGVRIALDDFGTAYSSIANLKHFRFDKIKIDRTFVCDLAHDNPYGLTFIRMIAELGAHLGITTTAEGVETDEQLQIVKESGCSEIQGYRVSRPVSAEAASDLVRKHNPLLRSAA